MAAARRCSAYTLGGLTFLLSGGKGNGLKSSALTSGAQCPKLASAKLLSVSSEGRVQLQAGELSLRNGSVAPRKS